MNRKAKYYIGIDPGTNTGYSIWDARQRKLVAVDSMKIHQAFQSIQMFDREVLNETHFRIEDARKRTWFGNAGREKLQGAGAAKRDATAWEDFAKDMKLSYEMVAPKNNKTKLDAATFAKITGWTEKTNEHGRDSAMLIYGI